MSSIRFLIGHRGVGKTSFLRRLLRYAERRGIPLQGIDLDREIEKRTGKTLTAYFAEHSETEFRDLEVTVLKEVLAELRSHSEAQKFQQTYIALGAGFSLQHLPEGADCLWLQRDTDSLGRVFFDRPRLRSELSPLEESRQLFAERESRFAQYARREYVIPEGLTEGDSDIEDLLFLVRPERLKASVTLLPSHCQSPERVFQFWDERKDWGLQFVELRDDLLSAEQLEWAYAAIPARQILYSFRSKEAERPVERRLQSFGSWDWPIEFGTCPFRIPPILSLHTRPDERPLAALLSRFEELGKGKSQLKLAIPIHNFSELKEAHLWAIMQRRNCSFLPSSEAGRWTWYRLLTKGSYPLSFIREGRGSSPDQPSLHEWLSCEDDPFRFAAVLGSSVAHSWTPQIQKKYFDTMSVPVFRVPVDESEIAKGALHTLREWGLQYAAVTSPYKKRLFEVCQSSSGRAESYLAVNSLHWSVEQEVWRGDFTDEEGWFEAWEKFCEKKAGELKQEYPELALGEGVLVLGGGGLLELLKSALPRAHFLSARQGEARQGSSLPEKIGVLLWACGDRLSDKAKQELEALAPTASWVFDLDYRENSLGREWALLHDCAYFGGETFFLAQAKEQREFWQKMDAGGPL